MKCRICENETDNRTFEAKEMMYGLRDIHHYFQCAQCGCLQINEFPENMQKYYDHAYYAFDPAPELSTIKRWLIRIRNKYALYETGMFGKLLSLLFPTTHLNFLHPIRESLNIKSRILDVGCGSGHLLQSFHETGFKNILGIDPYIETDIHYKNGLTIKKQSIHEIQGDYDLIMFHHSFEHAPDPIETLQSAFNLLAPDGYCLIQMPTVSSHAWKHYGVHWVQLDAPRHFFLQSIESMEILSKQTGFDLRDIIYDSTAFQFWASEQYMQDIPLRDDRSYAMHPENSIFSKEEIASFAKRANELNTDHQGDQATFYLRKSRT